MIIKPVALILVVCVLAGCSFYDVSTLAADAAFGTGVFSDEHRNREDWNGLWDPDISQCIRDEKELQPILRGLNTTESDQEFVTLPNGEKYPIKKQASSDGPVPGPTSICLSRNPD